MPEPVIQCVQLTKVFKDFWLRPRVKAVDAIDLDVQRGEVFGLLGPNGSGKSTTIKMILGLLHPTSGRIAVLNRSPRDVKIKEQIGYLPEESYLYKFLNARETLEYYGRLFHQDRRRRQRRIDELLEMVGLDKVQRRPIGEYSKGMQRRIGLAQALINDPQLLILDEPTTGLDPIGTRQIKDLIVRLKDVGKTVLLCSHLLADVEDVTDRCVIMFGGKVRRAGTIDELLTKHDETTITTDALPPEVEEQVVAALESRGLRGVQVRRSRQRLESLFLDIVDQAQREGLATAGAGNKGGVASFLTESPAPGNRGSGIQESPDAQVVIEQLTHEDQPSLIPEPRQLTKAEKPTADSVLEELTSNRPAEPTRRPAPGSGHPPPTAPLSPQPDRSVIDDLLGGP